MVDENRRHLRTATCPKCQTVNKLYTRDELRSFNCRKCRAKVI